MRQQSSGQFMELLEPIRDSLYRYARRAAWHAEDSADILQETVMTAWRKFSRFEMGTNFRAWVFQIMVNTVYRINKKHGRRRETTLDERADDLYVVIEREEAWSMLLNQPDKLNQLLDERLVHALDRLGVDERQCLLLRLLEGFSYREISSMMQIPVGTAMSHVHRARVRLREGLASLAVEHGLIKEAVQ